jgi:hypothetical protein
MPASNILQVGKEPLGQRILFLLGQLGCFGKGLLKSFRHVDASLVERIITARAKKKPMRNNDRPSVFLPEP